jgi:hypothetical protein
LRLIRSEIFTLDDKYEAQMKNEPIYFNKQTRDAYAQWAAESQYEYFVTLTFRGDITSATTADNAIKRFYKALCHNVYGKPTRRRLPFMAVREKRANGVWHWHILLSPLADGKWRPERFKEVVRKTWTAQGGPNGAPKYQNSNDEEWFQHLVGKEHKQNAYAYVCKWITDAETVNLATHRLAEHLQPTTERKTEPTGMQTPPTKPRFKSSAKAKPSFPISKGTTRTGNPNSPRGFALTGY